MRPAIEDDASPTGAFVAVVGPSGAGKDTVMAIAHRLLADEPRIHFVRRIITRPADAHEDHEPVGADEFGRRLALGAIALSWRAHGLSYGLPAAAVRRVERGEVVVANVSRGILDTLGERFPRHLVVEITADEGRRAARLAGRGRPSDGDLAGRVARDVAFDRSRAVAIDNDGDAGEAGARLAALILRQLP